MSSQRDFSKKRRTAPAASSRAKKHNKKTPPPKPPAKRFPFLLFGGTLLLAVGIGYGFYKLSVLPNDHVVESAPQIPDTQVAPSVQSPPSKPVVNAKAPEKDRFEFYEMLPKSKVTVKEKNYTSDISNAPKAVYLLQTGSFRKHTDADSLHAKLAISGFEKVHISETDDINGRRWFRVRVGPFKNDTQLNKAMDKLAQMGIKQPLRVKTVPKSQ